MPPIDKTKPTTDTSTAAIAAATSGATDVNGPAAVVESDAPLVPVTDAPIVGTLGEAAAALGWRPAIPVPVGGPGVGAERIAQRTEGVETVALDPRTADPRGPTVEDRYATDYRFGAPRAGDLDAARSSARTVVDPDAVRGSRYLEVLIQVVHDGRPYAPGEDIELDFTAYEQLVSIGAVAPVDWETGRPIDVSRVRFPRA